MSFVAQPGSWRRRLLFPAMTLLAAGLIALFARPAAPPPGSGEAIARFVGEGLRGGTLGATDGLVREALARSLDGVDPTTLSVEIRDGDPLPEPSGATHHAIVSRDARPWLVLRARYDPDPARQALVGVSAIE
jgi:hypothetical protein